MEAKDQIILALDVSTEREAVGLVKELRDSVGAFKVGLELFNSTGPGIMESLRSAGAERIFYDCKFHDIPNTVAKASRAAVRMGVWMFNVHTTGGTAMMRAAADAAADEAHRIGAAAPMVIGVTMLTSITDEALHHELSVPILMENHVTHLAQLAQDAGLNGVVASPHEISAIKGGCGPEFLVVTPGVRPAWAAADDQKRIMTPRQALDAGSDYLVIGRAITSAENPMKAAERILTELA